MDKKTRNTIKMANRKGYSLAFISFLAKVSKYEVIEVLEKGIEQKYLPTKSMPNMSRDYSLPTSLRKKWGKYEREN